jgi:hypothetical protein
VPFAFGVKGLRRSGVRIVLARVKRCCLTICAAFCRLRSHVTLQRYEASLNGVFDDLSVGEKQVRGHFETNVVRNAVFAFAFAVGDRDLDYVVY